MVYGRAWRHTQRLRALPAISTSSDAAVAAAATALQWHRRLLWCATNHRPTTDPLQQRGKWFCLPRRSNAASFLPSFVQRTLHSAGPVEGPKILMFKYIPSNGLLNGFACQVGLMQLRLFHRFLLLLVQRTLHSIGQVEDPKLGGATRGPSQRLYCPFKFLDLPPTLLTQAETD